MGVSAFPRYPRETWSGYILTWVINKIIYYGFTQMFIAPADYWRDPNDREGFLKHSRFLADANNERNFNQTRKDMWVNLKYARFIKFEQDRVIIPRESSWWGQYTEDFNVVSRFDTEVYQKDLIGIRTLEEEGRADFIAIPGDHIEVSLEKINELVEEPFLK